MKLEELINTIRESFVNDSPLTSDVRKQFDSLDFKGFNFILYDNIYTQLNSL